MNYQTNKEQLYFNFYVPGFMATNDTDEQGTRGVFFNHESRTARDYLMTTETFNS